MKCHEVEEFFKTGGIVSEMSAEFLLNIKRHIAGCPSCIAIEKRALEIKNLFQEIKPIRPPDFVWSRIQGEIQHSTNLRVEPESIVRRLKKWVESIGHWLTLPQPVWSATFAVMVLFTLSLVSQPELIQYKSMSSPLYKKQELFGLFSRDDESLGIALEIFL